jgi:hypothetical protein
MSTSLKQNKNTQSKAFASVSQVWLCCALQDAAQEDHYIYLVERFAEQISPHRTPLLTLSALRPWRYWARTVSIPASSSLRLVWDERMRGTGWPNAKWYMSCIGCNNWFCESTTYTSAAFWALHLVSRTRRSPEHGTICFTAMGPVLRWGCEPRLRRLYSGFLP